MYNIKSLISTIIMPVLCFVLPVKASTVPTDSLALKWMGEDSLRIGISLTSGVDDIKRNTRIIVTPVIAGDDGNSVTLRQIEFATKRNRKYNDRLAAFEGVERTGVYNEKDTVFYETVVPVDDWMLDTRLSLQIVREKEGCCNIEKISEEEVAETRYVIPYIPVAGMVAPVLSVAEKMAETQPVLCPSSEYRPFNSKVPLAKMRGALFVHFKVGKSKLEENFKENSITLEKIVEIMNSINADSISSISKIRIIGHASPEGPVALNNRLSKNRAEALKNFIDSRVKLPEECYEVIAAGEAWTDLEYVIENSDMPQRDELLEIIRTVEDPVRREALVRKLDGGKAFDYLKKEVFGNQRTSGYIQIYFDAKPDTDASAINEAVQLINSGNYEEAVKILEGLDDDRKYNALGTAYFMLGSKSRAMDCFEKAAKNGDAQAQENLKQLKK